jgi:two-component system, cell cycle sensor histidine kinase and response regulator CckA
MVASMSTTSASFNEAERLAELRRYEILDTPPEAAFDRITAIAADLFQVPISVISLVDHDRIWFKSRHGVRVEEMAREPGMCDSAIHGAEVYVVPDTKKDARAHEHSMVQGKDGIRFYAAAPLKTRRGHNLGTLCILDTTPRDLTPAQRDTLRDLANIVVDQLEFRLAKKTLAKAAADEALAQERKLFIGGPTVVFKWKAAENWPVEYVSPNIQRFGYKPEDLTSGKVFYTSILHPDDLKRVAEEIDTFSKSGVTTFEQEYRILTKDGQVRWIYDFTHVVRDDQGKITHYHGYMLDETARKLAEEALKESWAKYEAAVESFDGLIYICSMDYKIEFINKRFIERIGCNPIGQDCYRALHNRDSVCPWCVNDSVLRGKTVRWELLNPKDNRWYYVVNTPITHSDGRVSKMAMILDVTERKQAEELLKRREAILEAVAFASEQFMKKTAWEQCVQDVLARLGQSTGVSRVYISENHPIPGGEILCDRRYGWTGAGVASLMYNPDMHDFPLRARGFKRWMDKLSQGQVIEGHVREFPEAERSLLASFDIRSVLVVPIFVEQTWWGYFGFDSCSVEREWSSSEIDAFKTAAGLMGAAIQRRRSEEALRASEEKNRVILAAIPDLMFRINKAGVVLDFKAEKESDLLVPSDQIIGHKLEKLLPAKVAQQGMHFIKQTLATGQKHDYEYELLLGGKLKTYECRMVVSGEGEILSIVRDITERKQTDAQLTKLSRAVEQTADSVVITDKNGIVEFVNPAFEKLTGYSRQEVIGTTPGFLKSGKHAAAFYDRLWKAILGGEVFRAEFINRRKNGEYYYQDETITPIKDPSGHVMHFVSSGRDITDRVASQIALKESEQRLADIINFLPDATFAIDHNEKVIAWNRAIETITGVAAPEMLGKGDYEYAIPLYGKRRPGLASLVLKPDPNVNKEYMYVEKVRDTLIAEAFLPRIGANGIFAWIIASPLYDSMGRVTGAIESVRDITERKRAEEEIRKLAAFPQFNPNAVLEITADGALSYINNAAKEMSLSFGRENPADILPVNAKEIVQSCLSARESRQRIEVNIGDRTISWSFFPILESKTVHAYGVDITERLNREAQMRHLQKMEAVGRLAGGVAHDFNNILTTILGYLSMLLADKNLDLSVTEQLKEISKAAERASQLTRQLLTLSRKQTIQPKVLDLNDALKSLASMLQNILGENIALQVNAQPDSAVIRGDLSLLEQMLVNLVSSARDAMPQGGKITISTASAEFSSEQTRHNPEVRPGKFICMRVSDTRVGMNKDMQARIFEPFFTTRQHGKGAGLKLAMAYGIVQQHEGWIEVSSEEQRGATFHIYFPQYSEPS